MKKLLLLLLLSLSYVASADRVTYDSFGSGSDGSTCENDYWGISCWGGDIDGTVSYRQLGSLNRFDGDDGSECEFNLLGEFECTREDKSELVDDDDNEYINNAAERGRKTGEMMGKAIVEIFGGTPAESSGTSEQSGNKWEKIISNALSNNPTYGNNKYPMKGTPFYNFGTTYQWRVQYAEFGYGSDGMDCWFTSSTEMSCNNGVNYWLCGKKSCASDGTSYQSNIDNGGTLDYYCITSSFGSKCCGSETHKTCR